ncbi:MAG: hypothetical protein AB1758_26910 [Candidatus Eremiobacterota bacterium]
MVSWPFYLDLPWFPIMCLCFGLGFFCLGQIPRRDPPGWLLPLLGLAGVALPSWWKLHEAYGIGRL